MMKYKNTVKAIREQRLMSKAELARLAGVSSVTIDRIERGAECRMETKRKILIALGFDLSEKDKVFQQ
jgi:DNA-binding XRE family transcriptional regulator